MENKNIFEIASRENIRFDYKGQISVSDLYDLNVEELDSIYQNLNREKKQVSEESLLKPKTTVNTILTMKIDIVKYIVEYKLEETQKQLDRREKAEKKEKIMSILANKQDSELEGKTTDELQEMLNSL